MSALDLLSVLSAVGSGLVAGFFFAFSFCVMDALGKVPAAYGITAMQSINIVVINRWFLGTFFGTAALCALAVVVSFAQWHDARAPFWLAGGVSYLAGTIFVTMAFNVPRNDALAKQSVSSPEAVAVWTDYLSTWTRWNHVRMAAALVAAVLFSIALCA